VFCWGPFPGFRVNVVGREPRGLVQPSDYEATCDELVAGLLAFRHPRTGEPLFDWAAKTDDIYPGLPAQGTPDVLALTAGHAYGSDIHVPYPDAPVILQPEDVARFNPAAAHLTGNHRPEGVCILRGPGVKQGAVPAEPATRLDFLPTVLHLLGLAIPEGLEGRVIESALEQPVGDRAVYTDLSLAVEAAGSVQDYSGEEAEQVEERLRDLGYLE
jgi:predicted AlkP superfamily phosphohydrolase/phosphomutase